MNGWIHLAMGLSQAPYLGPRESSTIGGFTLRHTKTLFWQILLLSITEQERLHTESCSHVQSFHYKLVSITEAHQESHCSQGPLQCTSHMEGGSGIFTIIIIMQLLLFNQYLALRILSSKFWKQVQTWTIKKGSKLSVKSKLLSSQLYASQKFFFNILLQVLLKVCIIIPLPLQSRPPWCLANWNFFNKVYSHG